MIELEFGHTKNVDPRVGIIYTLIFSIIIALSNNIAVIGVGFLSSVLLVILIQLNIKLLIRRLLVVNIFILILWLILPFSTPGSVVFSLGRLKASTDGINYALLITLKSNAIIITGISLLSTCGIFNLVHAFSHLRVPDKINYLFFLLYRYIYVLISEYETLRQGLKVRGFEPRTSFHTYRTYGYLLGTLFLRGYDRSEKIHRAMVCRGFDGKYWLLDHFRMEKKDILALFLMSLNIIILLILQWTIY